MHELVLQSIPAGVETLLEMFEYRKISSVNCAEIVEPDVLPSHRFQGSLLLHADGVIEVFRDSRGDGVVRGEGKIGNGGNGGVKRLEKGGKSIEPFLDGLKMETWKQNKPRKDDTWNAQGF